MNKIKLDQKWHIEPDTISGWRLVFEEERIKTAKKTGKEEQYIYQDTFYYPKLSQILERYTEEACREECVDVEFLVNRLDQIQSAINKVKNIYVVQGELKQL